MLRWRQYTDVDLSGVALAAGLACLGALSVVTESEYAGGRLRLALALALQTLPLVWWRRQTLRAVLLSALGVAIEVAGVPAYGDPAGLLGFLVLVVAVPRWAPDSHRRLAASVLAAGFVVHLAAQPHEGPSGVIGPVVTTGALAAAAWFAGGALRRRSEREAQLEAAARRASAVQEELVAEERRRISRELHDIVGHALSAISLSAGAAAQQPGVSAEVGHALALIRSTSHSAASDVRRLVGLLRTSDDLDERSPQPTLSGLDALVASCRQAGLDVELTIAGPLTEIPLGVQLAAYRVVQEGLTNAVKHAPGAAVRVCVERAAETLRVLVVDDGPATTATVQPGHGLVGLTERVQLYDGELTARAGDGGGFRLEAVLPVAAA